MTNIFCDSELYYETSFLLRLNEWIDKQQREYACIYFELQKTL